MTESRAFWNIRARSYDSQVGAQYEKAYDRTVERTLRYLSPTDRVLEFACGTGIVTLRVAPYVAQVRAIDIAEEMVTRARGKAAAQGLTNVEIDRMELFDASLEPGGFDAVMAFNVLCYLKDRPEALARIRSLLKPGGIFLSATDCLGERFTGDGLRKLVWSRTGRMPYVAFDTMAGLERAVTDGGFTVVERENLYPAPPNLFLAARA